MLNLKTIALAGFLTIFMQGCPISLDSAQAFNVSVTNGGEEAVTAIIQLPDVTKQVRLAPGATDGAVGYEAGKYAVTLIINGEARDTYVASLTLLRDRLKAAIKSGSLTTEELKVILEQMPLVEKQLAALQGSGLPSCGGIVRVGRDSAIVGLVFNRPVAGAPGVWIPSCG
jgi:hypothetical protein